MSYEITITSTLSRHQQREVAEIYYDSFKIKFSKLWLFTKNKGLAIDVLSQSIDFRTGLYAIKDKEVIGFIGLETVGSIYTKLRFSLLTKVFGFFGGLWRYAGYMIYCAFRGRIREDEMHIDPIAVSEKARGLGVGTKLLDASLVLAKSLGKKKMTLEVVDTNPEAKKLYERKGFVVTKIEKTGFLTGLAGFTKVVHMRKVIE